MKVVDPEEEVVVGRASDEKIKVLAERAKKRLPLFQPNDHPDDFEEHDHYIRIKEVNQSISLFLSFWKAHEHDDDAEIIYTQIARIIRSDSGKPHRVVHQLPLPHSNPKIKTSKYVWKWHEVKGYVRRLMIMMVIREMAGRM